MNNLVSLSSLELHRYLGARPVSDSRVQFCIWSPTVDCVRIHLDGITERVALVKQDSGYHVGEIENVRVGDRYSCSIDGGAKRADPASRYQPTGVHGPSLSLSLST